MISQICALWDNAVKAFAPPFFVPANGLAVRAFADRCKDPASDQAKHPHDFQLYHLGTFDDLSGAFDMNPAPEIISRATDYVQQ